MSLQSARRSFYSHAGLRLQAELDVSLRRLHDKARCLVGATTHSDPRERSRLVGRVESLLQKGSFMDEDTLEQLIANLS